MMPSLSLLCFIILFAYHGSCIYGMEITRFATQKECEANIPEFIFTYNTDRALKLLTPINTHQYYQHILPFDENFKPYEGQHYRITNRKFTPHEAAAIMNNLVIFKDKYATQAHNLQALQYAFEKTSYEVIIFLIQKNRELLLCSEFKKFAVDRSLYEYLVYHRKDSHGEREFCMFRSFISAQVPYNNITHTFTKEDHAALIAYLKDNNDKKEFDEWIEYCQTHLPEWTPMKKLLAPPVLRGIDIGVDGADEKK